MMSSNNGARSSASGAGGMAAADDEALELLSSVQASTMALSPCDILQQVNGDDSLVCQMAEDGDGCTWE